MKTFALIGVWFCLTGLAHAVVDEPLALVEIDKQQTLIRLSDLVEGQERSFSFGDRNLVLTQKDGDFSVLLDGKDIHPLADLQAHTGQTGCNGKKIVIIKKGEPGDLSDMEKHVHAINIHQGDSGCDCKVVKKIVMALDDEDECCSKVDGLDIEQECSCAGHDASESEACGCDQKDCCLDETVEIDGQPVLLSSFAQVRRIMLVDEKAGLLRLTLLNPTTD